MDCPTRSASAVAALPDDPLVEILSRVPAKSVCRFKCVSRAWRDLITSPHHRKKLPQAMQGLVCITPEFSEAGERGSLFSIIDLIVRSAPLDIDPCFSFLRGLPEIQILVLNDSCNGLTIFEHRDTHSGSGLGYIVCNPMTKQWRAVPACHSLAWTNFTYTYLAFDLAVSSHFHLVQFQVGVGDKFISVCAYSSETGTWSHAGKQEEQGQLEGWHQFRFNLGQVVWPRCPFVNGFLHLLVLDAADQLKIVALDVQGKARRVITVPSLHDRDHRLCYFGQSQGHLHCMTQGVSDAHEGSYKLSIWVLQDYDTGEWVLKDTVDSLELFGKMTYRDCMLESESEIELQFNVVEIHRDCDVVFLNHPLSHTLIAYDMGRKEVGAIATFKYTKGLMCTGQYIPCFSELPVLTNKQ